MQPAQIRCSGTRCSMQTEQQLDGRWLAEVTEIPGVLDYGATHGEAMLHAQVLALRVIADHLERGEADAQRIHIKVGE